MSLYNQIFGWNPLCMALLSSLGIDPRAHHIPRLRDCYLVKTDQDEIEVAIHTRTGGGNRKEFADGNAYLQQVSGYLRDEDDAFDPTYATFYYASNDMVRDMVKNLAPVLGASPEIFFPPQPHVRWRRMLDDFGANRMTDDALRVRDLLPDIVSGVIDL